ncbi:hypothetical protein N7478_010724 [Penicillium angulare]|uniref:uncharacterized protein n=1 Tax=Penicillium angulare TaxID=116970 RepID=UPI0025400111|nr:uncharacterized protein N7478_010724 [Penicillium angulare]KAJ5267916.1 hypothetical protein N7478_010724 [Penicillium angulare]
MIVVYHRQMERSVTLAICDVNIDSRVTQEDLQDLSREERGLALRSAAIDIDAVLKELNHGLHISPSNCKEQCILNRPSAAMSSGTL